MAAVRLPEVDTARLKSRLYDEFSIEIPVYRWHGRPILRVSIQGYNTPEDTEALLAALHTLLPQETLK
jgi:isopenicillin-N epimerase